MPMHDWTRVSGGTYHDFHDSWITHLKEALNAGLLPSAYYALGEQRSGDIGPDVVALRTEEVEPEDRDGTAWDDDGQTGLIAVAEAPPRVRILQEAVEEVAFYLERRRTLVIRHTSEDRIVALIEIVSPANKHTHQTLDAFVSETARGLPRYAQIRFQNYSAVCARIAFNRSTRALLSSSEGWTLCSVAIAAARPAASPVRTTLPVSR